MRGILIASVLASGVASAQPPADRTFRVSVAAGAGRGFDTKDDCESLCEGVDLELGNALAPRLLVIAGFDALRTTDGKQPMHHAETISLQWWARDRLWLQGGAGVGTPRTISEYGMVYNGVVPAVTAAIGYEAIVGDAYSLGAQLRFASAIEDVHHASYLALLIGATFN